MQLVEQGGGDDSVGNTAGNSADDSAQDYSWDVLFRNATVFDGSGEAPQRMDIAVRRGRIAAKGAALPEGPAKRSIDA